MSEALATGKELAGTLERIVNLTVPAFLDGLRIAVDRNDGSPELILALGVREAASRFDVPLGARGRTVGSLCAFRYEARPLDDVDRSVLADLAMRLALAIETDQVLAREHRVADTLQRALLPEQLPQAPGVRLTAAYLPGTDEASVGGDWYDVFSLPDGRTAFSIGDVAGHGLEAAVVMGEVRQAFRAAAVNPKSPSLVLQRANTIVNMRPDTVIVTAIFGILDSATSTVTYAVAGHPPPVLATQCGTAQLLPAGGIPLGVAQDVQTRDWTFTVPSGALFVLYTDGLTEHSRDIASGEVELLEAIQTRIARGKPVTARDIVATVFAVRKNADDVAVLALAVAHEMPETFTFTFSALPLAVPMLRRALSRYADEQRIPAEPRHDLLMAVGEAVANAVEHAYPEEPGVVNVSARRSGDELIVNVRDEGRWKRNEPRDPRDERGRGLKIMRASAKRFEIRTNQTETVVTLSVHVGPG